MSPATLARPHQVRVKRSELRQKQRATLKKAKGRTVVLITANDEEDEKLVVDKAYFEEISRKLRAVAETLDIMMDQKLYAQILKAARTLNEDVRRGKLLSMEEVFGEK